MKRIAVVGAGWAGLSAAVRATELGAHVTVFEMADRPGGRARTDTHGQEALDNGQHILIGAYRDTLALMRTVEVEPEAVLHRRPLALVGPDGSGLRLPPGRAPVAFLQGVLAYRAWPLAARLRLLATAAGWAVGGFRCAPSASVATLCRHLPQAVQQDLVEPLCVAALNTPAAEASAQVFLRVLQDALFAGPGAADLLLPQRPLGELLPEPARAWLEARGATWRLRTRVLGLAPLARGYAGWQVNDEPFDAVLLACPAGEAARLAAPHSVEWARQAEAIRHEPIVTAVIDCPGATLPEPMIALKDGPAQFVFDHGTLWGLPGRLVFVISGAGPWVEGGRDALAQALIAQAVAVCSAVAQLGDGSPASPHVPAAPGGLPKIRSLLSERRATFRCVPGLLRPGLQVAPRLLAAGDYVDGPYPATLEGAVRAGAGAARQAWAEIT